MKILVTGATGFVGKHLLESLEDHDVSLLVRTPKNLRYRTFVKSLSASEDYRDCCEGVDAIVHLAALVHNVNARSQPSIEDFMSVNCDATTQLARCASESGVKHFIFLSSIKVSGEDTNGRGPFKASDPHSPVGDYGVSKSKAELQLFDIADNTEMTISVIRPPLIYGPGVKANFAGLVGAVRRGLPVINATGSGYRSMVSVWNVCSLANHLIANRPRSSATYLVSDQSDVTLGRLMKLISEGLGKKNGQITLPARQILFISRALGQGVRARKLLSNLQVDTTETERLLGWRPLHDTQEGIARMFKIE